MILAAISSSSLLPKVRHLASTPASYTYGQGYSLVGSDGGLFAYGTESYNGSMAGQTLAKPIVGEATLPGTDGYWEVGADGGVFAFGNAGFYGSMAGQSINAPVVGMATMPHGAGYWLVGSDGGIYAFGSAGFYGSMGGQSLNAPIVGMAATNDGRGYWLVGSDGGIYAFGDANFYGSEGGTTLPSPIVGMAANPGGTGYWMVSSGGGIYAFGDAQYYGGLGSTTLQKSIVGITPTQDGGGYWLDASDGGVVQFGDAQYLGGVPQGTTLGGPIVGMAAVSTTIYARNLQTNGDFSDSFEGWSGTGTTNTVIYGIGGVAGENPYQGSTFEAMNSTNDGGIIQQINTPIVAGNTYCVSAELSSQGTSSNATGTLSLFMLGTTAQQGTGVNYGPLAGSSQWKYYQTCIDAAGAHTQLQVQFYLGAGTTTADNVVVTRDLLTNGGFDQSMSSWSVLSGTNYAIYGPGGVTGESPYAGPYFLATNSNPGGGIDQQQTVATQIGETLCATAELSSQGTSSNATGSLTLSLQSSGSSDSSTVSYGPLAGSDTWVQYKTCVTATAQRQTLEFLISPGTGTTTVDDASVT